MTVEDTATAGVRAAGRRALIAWTMAIRPCSLLVALSPVLVGASFGYRRTGAIELPALLLVLVAALLMQVETNLQNDVGYTVRGADGDGTRSGFPRATATGDLSVLELRTAIVVVAIVALGVGLALAALRGWPVLAVGAASLAAALAYMGGPRPIAYSPFGELTVFVFFGIVAVTGTDWAVTGSTDFGTALSSMAIGALAAAALAVNNHRDAAHDRRVGRRTFAVTFGAIASGRLFALLVVGAFAMLPWIALQTRAPASLLPLVLMPAALKLQRTLARASDPHVLTGVLLRTFRLELEFAVLLSAGVLFG